MAKKRTAKTGIAQLQKKIAFNATAYERMQAVPQIARAVNRAQQVLEQYRRALEGRATAKEMLYVARLVERGWNLIKVEGKDADSGARL